MPLIPLWIKLAYTIMVAVIVPVYIRKYPLANFLWFSDVALFMVLIALWLESALVASMAAAGMLVLESAWNVDYFIRLLTGKRILGLTDYMFDKSKPLYLRALSLYHVVVPAAMIYLLYRLGYDNRALPAQIILMWIVLVVTFIVNPAYENVNWVRGFGAEPQKKIHPVLFLLLLMLGFPLFLVIPSHFLLLWLFG